jgi:hypothetical protein
VSESVGENKEECNTSHTHKGGLHCTYVCTWDYEELSTNYMVPKHGLALCHSSPGTIFVNT